jgi:hypothetical protein
VDGKAKASCGQNKIASMYDPIEGGHTDACDNRISKNDPLQATVKDNEEQIPL